MHRIVLRTERREQLVDITEQLGHAVRTLDVEDGALLVWSPHTTAGIAVNEGYDPDVARDLLSVLERTAPRDAGYAHAEGNSDSHLKALLAGPSQLVPVEGGSLALGRWQAVFFCEFDGPRSREVWVSALA